MQMVMTSDETQIQILANWPMSHAKRVTRDNRKNKPAMRTWGLMLSFIPFGWNALLKYQYLGVELLQVRR